MVFARVAEELHSQYVLGFDPLKRDGKVHTIEVKVGLCHHFSRKIL